MERSTMRKRALSVSWLPFFLAFLFTYPAYADDPEDILIVANRKCPVSSVTLNDVRAFFLKQKSAWSAGKRAYPFNAKRGSAIRSEFLRRVLEMDANTETSYWAEAKIMKGMTPPPEFGKNILKAVFKVDYSLGYVFRKDYKEGVVKVLYVIKKE